MPTAGTKAIFVEEIVLFKGLHGLFMGALGKLEEASQGRLGSGPFGPGRRSGRPSACRHPGEDAGCPQGLDVTGKHISGL